MLFAQVRFLRIIPYSYYLCKDCDCRTLDHRYALWFSIVYDCNNKFEIIVYIWPCSIVDWLNLLIWCTIGSGSIEKPELVFFFLVCKLKNSIIILSFGTFEPWAKPLFLFFIEIEYFMSLFFLYCQLFAVVRFLGHFQIFFSLVLNEGM
jgi:hypothetical protein